MIHIEGEIIINRPVEEVFDVVADERNELRYNPRLLCRMANSKRNSLSVGTETSVEG